MPTYEASRFKRPQPTLADAKETREEQIKSSRFTWVEESEADNVLADLLDDPKFQWRLREFLTDWSSTKGDLEFSIQCFIENYFERQPKGPQYEEDSEHG